MQKDLRLSEKEAEYVAGIIEGKTQKQAAIDANYSPSYVSSEVNNRPQVQNALEVFQAKLNAKITDERLIDKIGDLIEAKRRDKHGIEQPDNSVQYKSTELALRLKRYIKDKDSDVNVQVNIQNVLD